MRKVRPLIEGLETQTTNDNTKSRRPEYFGDLDILQRPTLGFYAPVRCKGELILRCYDLARRLRDSGVTVASRFRTPVELEVFHFLKKGKQPIIWALESEMNLSEMEVADQELVNSGRMLLVQQKSLNSFCKENANANEELSKMLLDLSNGLLLTHPDPADSIVPLKGFDKSTLPAFSLEPVRGAVHLQKFGTTEVKMIIEKVRQNYSARTRLQLVHADEVDL